MGSELLVMRPSTGQTGRAIGVAALAGGGYLAIRFIRAWQNPSGQGFFIGMIALIITACLAGYLLFFVKARIEVTDDRVLKVSSFGGRRSYPRSAVGGVSFRLIARRFSRGPDPLIGVVFSSEGRGLFTFSARLWDPADVNRLVQLLGSETDAMPATVSIGEFNREFPGALNVLERHPYVLGALLALVLIVAGVAFFSDGR